MGKYQDPSSVIDISYKDLENDYLEAIQDLKKTVAKYPGGIMIL